MQNWSGNQQWQPTRLAQPTTEEEVRQLVGQAREGGQRIRPVGSAHSFTPLSSTEDVAVDLAKLNGVRFSSLQEDSTCVRAQAGITLSALNDELYRHDLALENMGDIDVQTLAGAISTGTHGTGLAFGNLPTQVTALRMVNGRGEIVNCSETDKPELLRAARLSLGLLGIITEIELSCIPAYHLELQIEKRPLAEVVRNYGALNADCRHFEAYWFPHTPWVLSKQLRQIDATRATGNHPAVDYLQEIVLENYGFLALNELSYRFPHLSPRLSRVAAGLVSRHRKVAPSHRVFSTPRLVRFNEMEYALPLDVFPQAVQEIEQRVNTRYTSIFFPLEIRFVKGDTASYLSPAYGRDSVYIACHVYHKKEYLPYLRDVERIFRAYGGRPHWGKWHSLEYADLADMYPRFADFERQREIHDPDHLFVSPRMQALVQPTVAP
jgi:FAD-linked oxidoreductase